MSATPVGLGQPLQQRGRLDAAIIDLDGTLVDTVGDFVVALNLMLGELSLPPVDRAEVEPLLGKGSEQLIAAVLDHVSKRPLSFTDAVPKAIKSGAGPALHAAAWRSYQLHYLAINGRHAAVYPGVHEGLRWLQGQGLKLACLTNKPAAFAVPLLRAKGLESFFEVVFGGDAFERKKPDPLPVLKACEALGSLPRHTLMIGDSSNDARAARAAGCPVLLVTYGYNHGEPVRAVDADGYVDSLAAIDLAGLKTTMGFSPR